MNRPWKVVLAFVGVFLAGAVCGTALAPHWFRPERMFGRATRGPMMHRLETELELTPEQKEKIRPIVARTEMDAQRLRRESIQNFRALMDRMAAEINVELTPEQRVKFEGIRNRLRDRIERFRNQVRDRNRPPGSP